MPPYSPVEQDIVDVLDAVGADFGGRRVSNVKWTAKIKELLAAKAKMRGSTQCASHCANCEFLYDVTWLEGAPNDSIRRAELVLESEFGHWDDVLYDFRKLLLARAEHRIMVFEMKDHAENEKIVARMAHEISQFEGTRSGDRYMFACWQYANVWFQYELLIAP